MRVFANADVIAQSWYVAARSREVRPGRVTSCAVGGRRLALARGEDGRARAYDAACPHLGADLGLGRVVDGRLRCAFHGWEFDENGACARAPGCAEPPSRRARVYATEERWGLVWLFGGPVPLFPLPASRFGTAARAIRLPRQRVRCHPHLVIANGLDAAHYETLHGLTHSAEPTLREAGDGAIALELRGRFRSTPRRLATGTRRRDVVATFTTHGASVAVASIVEPIDAEVVFTGAPDGDGACLTQTIVLLPTRSPLAVARTAVLMATLLSDDRRVLDTIRFRPAFVESDAGLAAFSALVEQLPTW